MEHLTTDSFKEKIEGSNGLAVIDFFADWCGPCKRLAPVFEKVSKDITDAKFYKVDVEQANDLAMQFGIRSIPTILFFKDGQKVDQIMGMMDEDELADAVNQHLS